MTGGTARTKASERAKPSDGSETTETDSDDSQTTEETDMASAADGPGRRDGQKVGAELTDHYDNFDGLEARQVGWHDYRVLSTRNGSVTAHQVAIDERSCTCEDMHYNAEGQEVCAHISKALLVHPSTMDQAAVAARDLEVVTDRAREIVRSMEDVLNVERRTRSANAQAAVSDNGDDDGDDLPDDPVELAEDWLDRQGFDPDDFSVIEHDEFGSINIETESLDDDDFGDWMDLVPDLAGMNWDGDNDVNFVKEDDLGEVFG